MANMLTAQKAHEIAKQRQLNDLTEQINKITILIQNAAEDGDYSIDLDYYLLPGTYDYLKSLGYKIQSYNERNEIGVVISWKEAK